MPANGIAQVMASSAPLRLAAEARDGRSTAAVAKSVLSACIVFVSPCTDHFEGVSENVKHTFKHKSC